MCEWEGILVNATAEKIDVATPQVVLLGIAVPVGATNLDIAFTKDYRGYEKEAVKPEHLIEAAGRTCYKTHDRIDEESAAKFVKTRILGSGHLSVIEHSFAVFRINGGSRSFTHQLVRHRLMGISQESQRYCDEGNFRIIIPPSIQNHTLALAIYKFYMQVAKAVYKKLIRILGENFKEDARFVLPNAVESEIVVSANFRELRHIFDLRCDIHAQWEIREIALQMLRIMKKVAPSVFGDYVIDEEKRIAFSLPLTCERAIAILDKMLKSKKPKERLTIAKLGKDQLQALKHISCCPQSDCRKFANMAIEIY